MAPSAEPEAAALAIPKLQTDHHLDGYRVEIIEQS